MQAHTEIPGVGAVTVLNRFWSGARVWVDDVAVKRTGRTYALVGKDGGAVAATLKGVYFDTYPTVVVNGESYRTGPETALWLKVVAGLPLAVILVFLGGAMPVFAGFGGMALNLYILRSERSTNVKLGLMLGVLVLAFVATFGVVLLAARLL